MSQLIPFTASLPSHIKAKGTKAANPFAAFAATGGFPVISIKGKVFHVVTGDERKLITKRDSDGEPAAAIELVIVGMNPNKSKVFYTGGYVEGGNAKPTCFSNDGTAPDATAQEPQAKKCALCPHSQWGSKVSDSGKPGKACSDSARLAVTVPGRFDEPMLLRVPAGSFAALGAFGKDLGRVGVEPYQVITRVGFDYSVAHPALTFRPVAYVTDDMLVDIEAGRDTDTVQQIIGTLAAPATETDVEEAAPVAKPTPKPAAKKPEPAPVVEADDDEDEDDTPPPPPPKKAKRDLSAVMAEAEAAPKAPVKVEAKKEVAVADDFNEGLDNILSGFNFDD